MRPGPGNSFPPADMYALLSTNIWWFFPIFCITSNLNEKEMNCKSFDFFYFISGIEKNIKQNQIILNNFQKQSILCKKEQLISQINMYDTQKK